MKNGKMSLNITLNTLTTFDINEALADDIQPFLGCTDVCISALAAALAAQAAQGYVPHWLQPSSGRKVPLEIDPDAVISLTLQMNEGLYKNSHAGAIPAAGGRTGILNSAALGIFCDPEEQLNLFAQVGPDRIAKMEEIVSAGKVEIVIVNTPSCNLFLHATLKLRGSREGEVITAETRMEGSYTRVVFLKRNGETLYRIADNSPASSAQTVNFDMESLVRSLHHLSKEVLLKLEETVLLNTHAYKYGLGAAPGLAVGSRMQGIMQKGLMGNDSANLAAIKTAAAEDVRMAGENIPVMGITGSGSHGIAASIPVIAVAEKVKGDRTVLLKSIALSFRITQMVDTLNGHLTAPCGCVIKAGIGAAAGVAYYLGGTIEQIEQAMNNFIVSTAGVICDGAKPTCSIKLANSAANACRSALLALEGLTLTDETGGIVRENLQQNIDNMVRISRSMQSIDPVIVDILKEYGG
jgi:L-cysteine desulfidase